MARKWSDTQLKKAIESCSTISSVIRYLGLRPSGDNFNHIRKHIKRIGGYQHFNATSKNTIKKLGKVEHNMEKRQKARKKPLEEILTLDSSYQSSKLRQRLLDESIFEYVCSFCGLSEWLGDKIPLELDHINGRHSDNRIENLRLLCPNCHTLTPTYRGKKRKLPRKLCICGKYIKRESTKCRTCSNKDSGHKRRKISKCLDCCSPCKRNKSVRCWDCSLQHYKANYTKIEWPPVEKILNMLKDSSYLAVGRKLGVSDSAVRKFLRRNGIQDGRRAIVNVERLP